jgi:hypothetical protein
MNGLIASMVRDCVEKRSVKYINYLTLFSGSTKLIGFKKRVGFKSYVAFVDVQKFGDVSGRMPDPTARPNPIRRLAHGAKHLVMPW